jgi:hypothetical protein
MNVAVLCTYHDGIDPALETTLGVLETLFLVSIARGIWRAAVLGRS